MISPLKSPWDLSEWVSPWEVPQTPQNDFSNGKSPRPLRMIFPMGSPPDPSEWFSTWEVPHTPQNKGGDAPFHNYPPTPPIHEHFSILCISAYMTFFSFIFKFSRDLCQTAGGSAGLSLGSGDQGFAPSHYERGPWLLSWENRRKIEPKEILSCLIPRLLVVFTRQLEILVTALLRNHFLY